MKDLLKNTRTTLAALETEYWSINDRLQLAYKNNLTQFDDMLYQSKVVANIANTRKLIATLQDMPAED